MRRTRWVTLCAYIVSSTGAKKLHEAAMRDGVVTAWDWFVLRQAAVGLNLYITRPALVAHQLSMQFASEIGQPKEG